MILNDLIITANNTGLDLANVLTASAVVTPANGTYAGRGEVMANYNIDLNANTISFIVPARHLNVLNASSIGVTFNVLMPSGVKTAAVSVLAPFESVAEDITFSQGGGGGGDVPADLVEKVDDHQTVLYGNGGGEVGYDYTCLDPNADFAKTYDVQSHVMEVGAVCQDANWLSRFDGPDVKCNFIFCDLSQIQGTQYYGVNLQDTNSEWTGEFYVVVKEKVGTYNFDTIKFVDINGNQHACRLSFQSEKLMVISDTLSDVFSTNDESKINLPSGGNKGLIDKVEDLENKPAIPLKYNDGNIYDNEGNVVCGTYDDDQSERKIDGVKAGNGTIEIMEDRLTDNKTLTIGGMEVAKANPYSKAVSVFGVDVAGGGSSMVYDTTTRILSGAKDQNGAPYDFEVGTITITI